MMKEVTAKVLFLGDQGVGKTSILTRYNGGNFSTDVKTTVGASFSQTTLPVGDDSKVIMHIWDTAGQERFRSLVSMYYRNASAAFIVFDITDQDSYYEVRRWKEELEKFSGPNGTIILILANKSDLESQRVITKEMTQRLSAELDAPLFETSAKDNKGISEAFQALAEDISKNDKRVCELRKNWMVGGTSNGNGNGIGIEKNGVHKNLSAEKKSSSRCCD